MTFKPEFLATIGIEPQSVNNRITAHFTNVNESTLIIGSPDGDVAIETKPGFTNAKAQIADTLVKFGARRLG